MPLMPCPACGREISVEADACPQCGHPNYTARAAAPAPPAQTAPPAWGGPKCYACPNPATTRCQCCGLMSCAVHVESIYVSHGRGGAYELRCSSCYESAEAWKMFGYVFAGIVLVIILIMATTMGR
jgi:hypothetical protein